MISQKPDYAKVLPNKRERGPQNLPYRLRYYRCIQGISQKELAEKSGVCLRTIQDYEAGNRTPHFVNAYWLSVALKIDLDDFVEGPNVEAMNDAVESWRSILIERKREDCVKNYPERALRRFNDKNKGGAK